MNNQFTNFEPVTIFDCGFWTWEDTKILHANPNRAQDNLYKLSAQYLNVYGQETKKCCPYFEVMLRVTRRR